LASLPADMVNQKLADLGIPNRFSLTSSRSRRDPQCRVVRGEPPRSPDQAGGKPSRRPARGNAEPQHQRDDGLPRHRELYVGLQRPVASWLRLPEAGEQRRSAFRSSEARWLVMFRSSSSRRGPGPRRSTEYSRSHRAPCNPTPERCCATRPVWHEGRP
jgi:hypothetical protein